MVTRAAGARWTRPGSRCWRACCSRDAQSREPRGARFDTRGAVFTGIRQFELADDQTGDRVPLGVMYPTTTPPAQDKPGSFSDQLSPNAPVAPGKFLLVAISPGNGGSHPICRTVAAHLA